MGLLSCCGAVGDLALRVPFRLAEPVVTPVLRLVLLAAPLVSAPRNSHAGAIMMLGLWTLLLGKWGLETEPDLFLGVEADLLVVCLVALKTLVMLDYLGAVDATTTLPLLSDMSLSATHASTGAAWLIPALAAAALVGVMYLVSDADSDGATSSKKKGAYAQVGADAEPPPPQRESVLVRILVSMVLAAYPLVLVLVVDSGGTWVSRKGVLAIAEAAVSVALMRASSPPLGSWLWVQLCAWPMRMAGPMSLAFWVQTGTLGGLFLLTLFASSVVTPHGAWLLTLVSTPWLALKALAKWLGQVLSSDVPYRLAIIGALAVLITTMNSAWYTTRVDFPSWLRNVCTTVLDIEEDFIRPFYEFTNDPQLQQMLSLAVPQVAMVRAGIYRVFVPTQRWLDRGRDGAEHTTVPIRSTICLVLFCLGPVISGMASIAAVFPRGGTAFVRSRWFWFANLLTMIAFGAVTQLLTGPDVSLIAAVFEDAHYQRTYTTDGMYALWATGILVLSCLMLTIVQAEREIEEVYQSWDEERLSRQPRLQLRGRTAKVKPPKSYLARFTASINSFATAPSTLLTTGAILFLLIVVLTAGSPFKSIQPEKIKIYKRDWMVSTDFDKASPLLNSVSKLLISAVGEPVRMAMLLNVAIYVALREVGCLPCYCLPLGEIVDFAKDVGGWFKSAFGFRRRRRRRLLDYDPNGWSFDPSNLCSEPASASCDGITFCVADVVKPVVQLEQLMTRLLVEGMSFAIEEVVNEVVDLLPGLSLGILDAALERVHDLEQYADFDLLDKIQLHVPLEVFSVSLGVLPTWHNPFPAMPRVRSISITSTAVLVVLVLAAALGLLRRSLKLALRMAISTAVCTLVAVIACLLMMASFIQDELKIYEWRVNVEWDARVAGLYGIIAGMLVLAGFLFVAETLALPRKQVSQ